MERKKRVLAETATWGKMLFFFISLTFLCVFDFPDAKSITACLRQEKVSVHP